MSTRMHPGFPVATLKSATWTPARLFTLIARLLVIALLASCQVDIPQTENQPSSSTSESSPAAEDQPSPAQQGETPPPQQEGLVLQTNEGLVAAFDYRMADRFGLDNNLNNIPDLPNTREYVQNDAPFRVAGSETCPSLKLGLPTFTVFFNAAESDALSTLEIERYSWQISAEDGSVFELDGPQPCANLPEQAYTIFLTVISGEFGATIEKSIPVEDILFVSMGDSYSSGEGTPERRNRWADAGYNNQFIDWDHRRSHRSTLSWPAQSALAIELADPHTSVTFISVAATGATIERGLVGEFASASELEELEFLDKMPPQVIQVRDLVQERRIDIMTISTGINDIGFSNIATALMIKGASLSGTPLPEITEGNLKYTIDNGEWDELMANGPKLGYIREMLERNIPWRDRAGFNRLLQDFANLKNFIADQGLDDNLEDRDIYVMEYPDPTTYLTENGTPRY